MFVPDDAALQDTQVLMTHLLEASAYARGSTEGAGFARLLEAAACVIEQQQSECKVQRGLAIASQTLASELALKCEQLQVRSSPPYSAQLERAPVDAPISVSHMIRRVATMGSTSTIRLA